MFGNSSISLLVGVVLPIFIMSVNVLLVSAREDQSGSYNYIGDGSKSDPVEGAHLYPWGSASGDFHLSQIPDPESMELQAFAEVNLTLGSFILFKTSYNTLYVNRQGHISFTPGMEYLQALSQTQHIAFSFGSALVIPYLGEVDMANPNRGNVYYRESKDRTLLQMATKDVKTAFPSLKELNLNWIFVATWVEMAFWEPSYYQNASNCSCTSRRNTFQAILTTDGVHSFVIFNYNKLSWTKSPWSFSPKIPKIVYKYNSISYFNSSIAGFDYGNNPESTPESDPPMSKYTLPGSFTEEIINLTRTSNIEQPGKWVFRADTNLQSTNCDYSDKIEQIRAYPSYVPYLGGIPLRIKGPCLRNATNVECRFYDIKSPSRTNLTSVIITNGIVSDTKTFVTCESPLLYTSNGRVKLEVGFTHEFFRPDPSGEDKLIVVKEEKIFFGYIYTYVPPNYSPHYGTGLDLSIFENGDVNLKWKPEYFTNWGTGQRISLVELNLIELDWSAPDPRMGGKGPLKMTVFNSGSYTWLLGTAGLFKNPLAGYFAYLKPIGENYGDLRDHHLYSGIAYTNFSKTREQYLQLCGDVLTKDPGLENLLECPPLLSQAWVDWTFQYDWNSSPEKLQFRQRVPNSIGQGQRCVYDKTGNLITSSPADAGWPDTSSPNGPGGMVGHHIKDILPFNLCCKFSKSIELCSRFYDKRASNTGAGYIPPPLGMWRGDPHITTFDNASYTFNGIGEFWMIKINNVDFATQIYGKNGKFEMQARMTRLVEVEKGVLKFGNASVFSGFAMKSGDIFVQVELAQTGLRVWLNKEEVDLLEVGFKTTGQPVILTTEGVSIALFSSAGTGESEIDRVVLAFQSGFTFDISSANGLALNVVASASPKLKGKGGFSGLLGDFDGNPGNDLKGMDGIQLVNVNSSLQNIHNKFGISWRTTEGESLFLYTGGKTHASFQDPTFTPNFKEPNISTLPKTVVEMCAGSRECLFDYSSTGSLTIANGTKELGNRIVMMREVLRRKPCQGGYLNCRGNDTGVTFTVPTMVPTHPTVVPTHHGEGTGSTTKKSTGGGRSENVNSFGTMMMSSVFICVFAFGLV